MEQIFAFTLDTKEAFYHTGSCVAASDGTIIGRVLRCRKKEIDEDNIFYSYDIESSEETFMKLKSKEIGIFRVNEYSVYRCSVAYMRGI